MYLDMSAPIQHMVCVSVYAPNPTVLSHKIHAPPGRKQARLSVRLAVEQQILV